MTPEELNEFNPYLNRLFGGLEFEERDGNIAIHEPEERYSADGEELGRKYTTGADGRERAVTSRDSEDGDKTMLRDGEDMTDGERFLAILALEPIEVERNELSKAELREMYNNLPSVKKNGVEIEFYHSAFKKIHKEGGLFEQVIPVLNKVLDNSVLAYTEADNLGGTIRPDGTEHKEHKNVL